MEPLAPRALGLALRLHAEVPHLVRGPGITPELAPSALALEPIFVRQDHRRGGHVIR